MYEIGGEGKHAMEAHTFLFSAFWAERDAPLRGA
jgi:hypothetical protein